MATLNLLPGHQGPATHAFIIGVGSYHHLKPGDAWGLGQLSTAPVSAQRFANWLLQRYSDPGRPLASIEHLISGGTFTDHANVVHASEEPELARIEAAYTQWFERANRHPDNLALFYFCGHGLCNSRGSTLLAADFADPRFQRTSRNAIHVEGTANAMLACKAKYQCFFLDCCRTTDLEWQNIMEEPGQPLGTARSTDLTAAHQPMFFAAGRTEAATGVAADVTVFTKALIEALDGMAAVEPDGDLDAQSWRVNTGSIAAAIDSAIAVERHQKPHIPDLHCHFGGNGAHFDLNYPHLPLSIPVVVGCDPEHLTGQAQFRLEHGERGEVGRRDARAGLWISRQEPSTYHASASVPNNAPQTKTFLLYPPSKRALLKFP